MDKNLKKLFKNLKLNEDTISTILGGIVVIIIAVLVFNYFRNLNQGQVATTNTEQEQTSTPTLGQPVLVEEEGVIVPQGLPTTYKVVAGDHLWGIAEKFYNSGYNWVDIATANNLGNGNAIEVGTELSIPKVGVKLATVETSAMMEESQPQAMSADYTVVAGDSLWSIAAAKLGDGYAWTRIYDLNHEAIGANPSAIEKGMVLKLQ